MKSMHVLGSVLCLFVSGYALADVHLAPGTCIHFGDGSTQDCANPPSDHGGSGCSVSGVHSYVGGGGANVAADDYATVGGGLFNKAGDPTTPASDAWYATIGGGYFNTANDYHATVGGGSQNTASGNSATIGGGGLNSATNYYTTVGGGYHNVAGGYISTVAGGAENSANGYEAAVGGGYTNEASGNYAVVAGGYCNEASAPESAVLGGSTNLASGSDGAVLGGSSNVAAGNYSAVGGGYDNDASGDFSFAAGYRAGATHQQSFVWNGYSTQKTSANPYTFNVWAPNGIYLNGSILAGSDRNAKEKIEPLEGREVLERVAAMAISIWEYKDEPGAIKHAGPMAQDFYAAFGLGTDDKHIATIDADGVALAAIQGLNELVREKDAKIAELEARLAAIEKVVVKLTAEQHPSANDQPNVGG